VSVSLKRNIVANFIGNSWATVMSLAFIPLYIHFMGIEAYGLVGFFLVLQATFCLLDMGLSATLSREMARLSVQPEKAQEMRNLARTLEIIYWAIAVVIGVVVITFASTITHRWLHAGQLATGTIEQAIVLMGLALSLQWPFSLYSGGLGVAPGVNIGDEVAIFEPTHGSAPKYAGKDMVNPTSFLLSGAMMLKYMELEKASILVEQAVKGTIGRGIVTYDLARQIDGAVPVKCSVFGQEVAKRVGE